VRLVEVYATVTDRAGAPITGLQASNFHVLEDGVEQHVTVFAAGEFPLSVAIAIDRSFSMSGKPLALARQGAQTFVNALRPEDEVMVTTIGGEIQTLTAPSPARVAASTPWSTIEPWGVTPLYDATYQSIDAVVQRQGRRALLVISDGADRGSEVRAADLIAHARDAGVMLYPVSVAKRPAPVLAELAAVTGGRVVTMTDPKTVEREMTAFARELRTQYLLGYAPPDATAKRSGWHALDVRVDRLDVRVRARDGYAVP